MTDLRRAGLVLSVLFIVSLPAVTPRIYASDEIQYYAFLRSLWFDGDLSFDNEYRYFYDSGLAKNPGFHETFLERTTATGRRENFGTIGSAVLWAPFYAVGHAVAHAMKALGASVAVDGYSQPYVAAVAYGSALYGFLALLLAWHALRMIAPTEGRDGTVRSPELAAIAAVWLGTPLLFYMYVAPPMAHAASAFAVAVFVVSWLHVRRTWSAAGCALLGGLTALMAMVREQDIFFALGPALDFLWFVIALRRRGVGGARGPSLSPRHVFVRTAAGLGTFAAAFAPQVLAYLVINGRVGPSPLVARKMTWSSPHALQVLASPEHGLLFWTPLVLLALAGLFSLAGRGAPQGRRAPRRSPSGDRAVGDPRRVGFLMLVMVAFQVYIAGSVESWTVAGAFGQRRLVGLTILLVVGLGILATRARRGLRRGLLYAAFAAAAWWNLGLMVQFGAGLMDRQRLDPARNAYNTFVVVPQQAPRLAYRYLFERQSFYQVPDQSR